MKRICSLILVLLVMAGAASAEVREFTKLSINIPEGWSAEEVAGTVAAVKDDKTASLTISVEHYEDGHNLADMAQIYSQNFKGTTPKPAQNGGYTFSFNNENTQAIIYGGIRSYILITMTGIINAPEDFKTMTASMSLKEKL